MACFAQGRSLDAVKSGINPTQQYGQSETAPTIVAWRIDDK